MDVDSACVLLKEIVNGKRLPAQLTATGLGACSILLRTKGASEELQLELQRMAESRGRTVTYYYATELMEIT